MMLPINIQLSQHCGLCMRVLGHHCHKLCEYFDVAHQLICSVLHTLCVYISVILLQYALLIEGLDDQVQK
jgi:hypothetical protein